MYFHNNQQQNIGVSGISEGVQVWFMCVCYYVVKDELRSQLDYYMN